MQPAAARPKHLILPGRRYHGTDPKLAAAAASHPVADMEIRRNLYDQHSRDLSHNQPGPLANGETNGTVSNGPLSVDADMRRAIAAEKAKKQPIFCKACGNDCTKVRYHYAKPGTKIQYNICSDCYINGHFKRFMDPLPFMKIEDANHTGLTDRDTPWDQSELLLLLEGIEMFDDDWDRLAEHVGTRTRKECIAKFLSLDIEDPYLEESAAGDESSRENFSAYNYGHVPVGHAENPGMTAASWLAGNVDPAVAAAAASRSVEQMRALLEKTAFSKSSGQSESGKDNAPPAAADRMDVERDSSPQATSENQISTIDNSKDNPKDSHVSSSAMGLAAAAARGAALATEEERVMTYFVGMAVNNVLERLDIKMQHFNELENALQEDRIELDRGRRELLLERLAFERKLRAVEDRLGELGLGSLASEAEVDVQPKQSLDALEPLGADTEGYKSHEVQMPAIGI
jgi:SWI/SNF related-matrix-associated actin-dependent regulator of chromatin subfamily C